MLKTPSGFELRRQLCGGPTADFPADILVLIELTTQRFQSHKGDARSSRKMPDACVVNVVFLWIVIRVFCVLICIILTYNLKFFS